MKRKIIFFINPISGARSKVSLEKAIIDSCERENTSFEILFTSKDGNYSFLPERILKEGITDVVICGGDGSVGPIITYLLNVAVNVGIIPLGSGNGLARTAGIPYSIPKAIHVIFDGVPKYVDAFMVNDRLGCQITGWGFDAFIAQEFARERKRGLSTYTKLAVKHFLKAKPYHFEIETEGASFSTDAFIVCVSNANQFGNNVKIAPMASLSDGLLDVVVLKKTTKLRILSAFVNHLLFAKKKETILSRPSEKKIQYFNTKKVVIKNIELAPMHIDGDPISATREYVVEVLSNAYKLIHPA